MRTDRRGSLLKRKIKSLMALEKIASRLHNNRKRLVFTNGCFDLLHYGHVKYLEQAKQKGDTLIVAVNSDSSVKRIKGNARPVVNEKDRLSLVAALESVDYVFLFNEDTPLKAIKKLKPDILVKGSDWRKQDIAGGDFVLNSGGKVLTVKLVKNRSTTDLVKKIVSLYSKEQN